MLWSVGINLNTTTVTPVACRVRCAPYAYMGKVYAGNTVTAPAVRSTCRAYYYKWCCSRFYVIEKCRVGPSSITLGTTLGCYKSYRWGRQSVDESSRLSDDYPYYLHSFRYHPNECFEATKAFRRFFTPYGTGPGTCFRQPSQEDLGAIHTKFQNDYPQLFSSGAESTLVFYYEAFGGRLYNNPRLDFCPANDGLPVWVNTSSESGRDYWLTVFAL